MKFVSVDLRSNGHSDLTAVLVARHGLLAMCDHLISYRVP
jgi:hypothetical protein